MGLDISHYRAVSILPEPKLHLNQGCLFENDFKYFKDGGRALDSHIKEIQYCKVLNSLSVVNSQKHMNILCKKNEFNEIFNYPKINFVYGNSEEELKLKIYEFESSLELTNSKKFFKPGSWQTIQYYQIEFKHGLYFVSIGYQRKGMNELFWNYFNYNSEFRYFTGEEDFLNAYKCVEVDKDLGEGAEAYNSKAEFKANFIDKFEFGTSFLGLSY